MKFALSRLASGIVVVSTVFLAGCSSPAAQSNSPETTASASVQLPDGTITLPAGYVSAGIGVDLTSTATVRPKEGNVVVPSGELTLTEVKSLDWISPTQITTDPPPLPEDSQYVQALAPAEGEKLYALSLGFMPSRVDDAPETDVSISVSGVQKHLYTFDKVPAFSQPVLDDRRLLVAIPEGADAKLVVAAGSHEQYLSLPTGERVPDEVAAAYYLPTTKQEPMHSFEIKKASYKDQDGDPNAVLLDAQVDTVELTAWSPEDGWVTPGQAWLAVTWSVDAEFGEYSAKFGNSKATLNVLADGVQASGQISWSGYDSSDSTTTYVKVPVTTRKVSLDVSAAVRATSSWGDFSKDLKMTSEKLEVSFPKG